MTRTRSTGLGLGLALALVAAAPDAPRDAAVGASYRIPYKLTATNHHLVRVRINGKGPFNFLVDTGAPALYVGTEAAAAIGLEPAGKGQVWTPIARLDLEGGASLSGLKARVEDPFQLTGMNALGLPGARIDGILGFTILAKFRMEFDPTSDRMTWTRVDFDPKEPFIPPGNPADAMPAEVRLMSAMGPAMKLAAVFVGKQPEEVRLGRGSLGLALAEGAKGEVLVAAVLAGSPAEKAGLRAGDRLVSIAGKEVAASRSAHEAVAAVKAGDPVAATVRRGAEEIRAEMTAGEGF